jgi:hypothetical protein
MTSTLGFNRRMTATLVLCVATLALASEKAKAQLPGYEGGYGFPDTGFGGFVSPFDYGIYGITGFDYGVSGLTYPGAGGFNYGAGGIDYGLGAFGFPPYGASGYGGYSVGPGFGTGGTVNGLAYMGTLFGSGTTALGNQGYVNGSNRPGRAQVAADRRAKTRKLQQQRGGGF